MQVISGVSLPAYWLSNFIFDIAKTYIPITMIIILNYAFPYEKEHSRQIIWPLLIYPLAIVPFTYMTSLCFNSDNAA